MAKVAKRLDALYRDFAHRQVGKTGLRPRDSNPEIQLQRLACCQLHQGATRRAEEYRRAGSTADQAPIAERSLSGSAICSLAPETSTPSASRRRASARSSERSTLRAPATRPSFRYQTENSPLSRSPRQISSSQSLAGPTYSRLGPVGEVAEEVGDDLVVGVVAEHVAGGVHALLHRHVPVLDPDAAAVDDAVVGAAVAGGVDALGRGLQLRVADDAVVDLEAGALGQHRVGAHAGADDDRVALDRQAALGQRRALTRPSPS